MATDSRKEYTVKINGVDHTLLLDPEDAERYGDGATLVRQARTAKATTPDNTGGTAENK